MFTYSTEGNGFTIEIFEDGESVNFYQGEQAGVILKRLNETETNAEEQKVLADPEMVLTDFYEEMGVW